MTDRIDDLVDAAEANLAFADAMRLVLAWRETDADSFWSPGFWCIEKNKVALAALRRLGVSARPLPCGIAVANALARHLIDEGVPVSDWPDAAWSVGVEPENKQAPPPPQGGRGWDGHLITEGDGWIADFSGADFARSMRIEIAAWATIPPDGWNDLDDRNVGVWFTGSDGSASIYVSPRRRLARWRNGSAWRSDPPADLVDRLVDHVRNSRHEEGADDG